MGRDANVPDKMDMWRELRFDILFKGDDWKGAPKGLRLDRAFGEIDVEVVYLPRTQSTSSTALRTALRNISEMGDRLLRAPQERSLGRRELGLV